MKKTSQQDKIIIVPHLCATEKEGSNQEMMSWLEVSLSLLTQELRDTTRASELLQLVGVLIFSHCCFLKRYNYSRPIIIGKQGLTFHGGSIFLA